MRTIVYKHLPPVIRVFDFYMAEFHIVLEQFCDLLSKCLPVAFCKLRKTILSMYLYMKNILNVSANSALLRELRYVRDKNFFSLCLQRAVAGSPVCFTGSAMSFKPFV